MLSTGYQAKLGEYTLGKKLGVGQYSKVREGKKASNTYAVKFMPISGESLDDRRLKLVLNEAKIMSSLDHPNIVKLHEFNPKAVLTKPSGCSRPVMYLVFDLITGGELFDYVALGGRLPDKVARYYFHQLIEAVEFLHSKGFAHRDIKAENLLLDSAYNLKLADFGFSAPLAGRDGSGKMHTYKGTKGYMAPEIFANSPSYSGEKVDIFATGVLLFIMVARHPPFSAAIPSQVHFYKLFCHNNPAFWKAVEANKPPGTFSPEFKDLVNKLMALEPANRPTIAQIKQHAWYTGPVATLDELKKEFEARRSKELESYHKEAEEKLRAKGKLPEESKGPWISGHLLGTRSGVLQAEKTAIPDFDFGAVYRPTTMLIDEAAETIIEKMRQYFEEQKCDVTEGKSAYKMRASFPEREVEMKVRVERAGESRCCVDVERVGGDKMEFLEVYKAIREFVIGQKLI